MTSNELKKMEDWIDRHSVNCYFCSKLFDERDGLPADDYNGNDGGSICPECLAKKEVTMARYQCKECGREETGETDCLKHALKYGHKE